MLVCSVESFFSFFGNALLFYKFFELLTVKRTDPANTKFKLDIWYDDDHCMRVNKVVTTVSAVTESEYLQLFYGNGFQFSFLTLS
jgi:hypothetical protein